jgi:hypothetical protein
MTDAIVRTILSGSIHRLAMLRVVASLDLPDAWLAAGAVRNAVWDALHAYDTATPLADADVIWFAPDRPDPAEDRRLETVLCARLPGVRWSVRNQARMHHRHGHAPYANCLDAMRAWPETATSVAARVVRDGGIALQAAYGFDDLVGLILRPGPHCAPAVFRQRLDSKGWLRLWPRLTIASGNSGAATSGMAS